MDSYYTLLSSIHSNVSNFRQMLSNSGVSLYLQTIFIWSIPFIFFLLAATAPVWLLFSNKKVQTKKTIKKVPAGDPSETLHRKYNGNHVFDDSKYSMELQIQEVLLASLSSDTASIASSSSQGRIEDVDSRQVKIDNDVDNASQIFCGICMEAKESWEMFRNDTCDHSFCYECTSQHIVAKIQDNLKIISCPGADCKATLDFNICRLMIPKDVLAKWDDFLCQSLIPNSQKLFCPFRDCSAMLIHDSGEVIKEIKCPACRRSFCAQCHVPWHSEFKCKEFQKLNAKKGGKDDGLFKLLAKKKSWQKCPSCKMHVEKIEGCIHITCRCSYEFCYRCGSKWTSSHACKKS
ncbi:probable E3 ubiquitin-protein ligase RNF217 [Coffea eugenioides]|uniref:probable E3 ubiquitin-protein ligase RNF217 n=1 Tax=Coffea eugenioides TaxID=49369 RepID=UPI000F60D142|nr:probable E3 ubiquitin-protein ligase RNF217 [Coffea eugenioides]